uniref:Probable prefoldin subunit 6 n=1 Tax=Meloidogyne incognita TaxID=6306 RepID=A0A914N3P0_MELIC
METLENLKSSFDQDVEKMRQLERDRTRCITNRKQLESQMTENKMVKEELDRLEEGAEVFKLIGPVLVKQELGEAKENVQKRIDYIQKEIERTELTLTEAAKNIEDHKESIEKTRNKLRQAIEKNAA